MTQFFFVIQKQQHNNKLFIVYGSNYTEVKNNIKSGYDTYGKNIKLCKEPVDLLVVKHLVNNEHATLMLNTEAKSKGLLKKIIYLFIEKNSKSKKRVSKNKAESFQSDKIIAKINRVVSKHTTDSENK